VTNDLHLKDRNRRQTS